MKSNRSSLYCIVGLVLVALAICLAVRIVPSKEQKPQNSSTVSKVKQTKATEEEDSKPLSFSVPLNPEFTTK